MKQYKSVLTEDFATFLYNFADDTVRSKRKDPVSFYLNKAWDDYIVHDSAPVICIRIPQELVDQFNVQMEQQGIINLQEDNLPSYGQVMLYVWTKNSYIAEHSDSHGKAITIYLNKEWKYNDGGMFNWFDEESQEWKSVLPSFNLAIVNNSKTLHGTSPVKADDKFRITLQCFVTKKENND
jgi:Rps23 Pro-64 3,4-dihydroxylase Tpa1-like proline 4-hydroxylase